MSFTDHEPSTEIVSKFLSSALIRYFIITSQKDSPISFASAIQTDFFYIKKFTFTLDLIEWWYRLGFIL